VSRKFWCGITSFFIEFGKAKHISLLFQIWFRELPDPVLHEVPSEVILQCTDEDACVREFDRLVTQPNRGLVLWLLDLMTVVTMEEEKNKMNARNLGEFSSMHSF
jgi:hypothetical protein